MSACPVTKMMGKELFVRAGPEIVRGIRATGASVFLDLKFHDIPNTVARAVEAATQLDVQMLTIHTSGGSKMIRAAERAAHLNSMAGLDRRADLGGHQPARIAADVEDEFAGSGGAVEAHCGAEIARREAPEFHAEILPGPHRDRRIEQHRDLDDV